MPLTYHVGDDKFRWLDDAICSARAIADARFDMDAIGADHGVAVKARFSVAGKVQGEYTAFVARPTDIVKGKADARA